MRLNEPSRLRDALMPVVDKLDAAMGKRFKLGSLTIEVYVPYTDQRDVYALVWGYSPFGNRVFRRFRFNHEDKKVARLVERAHLRKSPYDARAAYALAEIASDEAHTAFLGGQYRSFRKV